MAIYLDSADPADALVASEYGFVAGITTNPALLAGTDHLQRIAELLEAFAEVPIFYQLTRLPSFAVGKTDQFKVHNVVYETGQTAAGKVAAPAESPEPLDTEVVEALASEADEIHSLDPARIVIKLPSRTETFALAARLNKKRMRTAMTAIFSPAQALLATDVGAGWVIPYVGRTTRLGGNGLALVGAMRRAIDGCGGSTRVMAGSIKTPDDAAEAAAAGAHDLTMGLGVIDAMARHDWSEQSIADFARHLRKDES